MRRHRPAYRRVRSELPYTRDTQRGKFGGFCHRFSILHPAQHFKSLLRLRSSVAARATTASSFTLNFWRRRGSRGLAGGNCGGEKYSIAPHHRRRMAFPGNFRFPFDVAAVAPGRWRITARHAVKEGSRHCGQCQAAAPACGTDAMQESMSEVRLLSERSHFSSPFPYTWRFNASYEWVFRRIIILNPSVLTYLNRSARRST